MAYLKYTGSFLQIQILLIIVSCTVITVHLHFGNILKGGLPLDSNPSMEKMPKKSAHASKYPRLTDVYYNLEKQNAAS